LKKIILFLTIISSLYSSQNDAKFYFGLGYGYISENFSGGEGYDDVASQTANIKFGYGIRSSYAVEMAINYIEKDKDMFSQKDNDRYSFDLAVMKAFDFDIYINPFIKAGFGAGYLHTDNKDNSVISFSSYNLSTGIFIPMGESFDMELGYIYKYLSYERLTSDSKKLHSNMNVGYVGINYRF